MTERFDKQIAEGNADQAIREKVNAQHGTRSGFSTFYRFIVLETIFDPQIVDDKKIAYWEHDLGVSNIKFASVLPRNSIIAQRVQEGVASSTETPIFLFPFLPSNISLPCNPGEHVWVYFENKAITKSDLGFWLWRIVGPGFVEDVNHTHMPRVYDPSFHPGTKDLYDNTDGPTYEFKPGQVDIRDGERISVFETSTISTSDEQIYEKLMTVTDGGRLRHYEPVPRYRKRPGDTAFEGTNNALIVLGRHRTGQVADYNDDEDRGRTPKIPSADMIDDGAATIDLVVGRGQTPETLGTTVENSLGNKELGKSSNELSEKEGDPDLKNDRSRVLISQKMMVDTDFDLAGFNGQFSIEDENGVGAVVVKTDKIRLIARSDIQLIVKGNEKDNNGNLKDGDDENDYATMIIKVNGDIIFKPSKTGFFKIGGEDADKALVCSDVPAAQLPDPTDPTETIVSAPPIMTTMGGAFAGTKIAGQGSYAKKILTT